MSTLLIVAQIVGVLTAVQSLAWDDRPPYDGMYNRYEPGGHGHYPERYAMPRTLVPMRVVVPSHAYRTPGDYDFSFMPVWGPGGDLGTTPRPEIVLRKITNRTAPVLEPIAQKQRDSSAYEPTTTTTTKTTTTEFTHTESTLPPEDTTTLPRETEADTGTSTSTPTEYVEPSTAEVVELRADTSAQTEATQMPTEATETERTTEEYEAVPNESTASEPAPTEHADYTPEPAGGSRGTTEDYADYTFEYDTSGTGDYGPLGLGQDGDEYVDDDTKGSAGGEDVPQPPQVPEEEEYPEFDSGEYSL